MGQVNYFGKLGCTVHEAGMLRGPIDTPVPFGASPDALVVWPDGTTEPLELKNHSPFAPSGDGWVVRDHGPFGEVRQLPDPLYD